MWRSRSDGGDIECFSMNTLEPDGLNQRERFTADVAAICDEPPRSTNEPLRAMKFRRMRCRNVLEKVEFPTRPQDPLDFAENRRRIPHRTQDEGTNHRVRRFALDLLGRRYDPR